MDLTATVQRLTKADYLDGLGIAIGSREVSLVHVSKRVLRVSLRHARTVPLPESGRERLDAYEQALSQFLRDIEVTPDHVVLCLSRRVACVSRLMVPETARGSLSQVIDYEVERLLPFSREDIYYDYLVYDVAGGEERRLGVVIFGLPRREVDEHLAVLTHTQVRPQIVTLSSAALVNTLAFCGPASDLPCVLVAPENGQVELGFIEKNRLVASHLFPLGQMREQRQFTELLAQGVARNLPGAAPLETAIFAWGTNGALPLTLDAEHDLCALVTTRFSQGEGPLPVAALPALGAALQAVGEAVVEINLLPPDKRAQREKRLSPLTLALVSFLLFLGVVWALSVVVQEQHILKVLAQQIEAMNPEVRQVQTQEEEAARLRAGLQALGATTRARVIPLLRNLSEVIPTDVYLTSFRYKDGDVELSGVATRPASDLVAVLESSPCLRNVAPKAPFTKTANGETFTLGAQVDTCE